jgi:GrpB-like predicted nucleotidyltransferase (UPF0157 family)
LSDGESLNRAIHEPVVIVPYDPAWPGKFEAERIRIVTLLPRLEHIGSTAVPGLPAKPIIDCMAAVGSMEIADALVEQFCQNGYVTSAEFNRSLGDRRWLMRHAAGRRTHHLHLVLESGTHLTDAIRFRDALRGDTRLIAEYAGLKERLSREFGDDREGYTKAKSDFIAAALGNHRAESAPPEQGPGLRTLARRDLARIRQK